MKKRSPFNYVARIERVQKWFATNPGKHVNELLAEMSETPRGTLSSLLSHMQGAGHLIRKSKGYYSLPELTASARSVAYDIHKLKKSPTLFRKGRTPQVMPQNAPIQNQASNLLQPVTTNEQISKNVLAEFKRNKEIMEAVDLLKSYGVKVTLEF